MITAEIGLEWADYDRSFHPIEPGSWIPCTPRRNPAGQLTFHLDAHEYVLERIDTKLSLIDDVVAGRYRPGWFGADNDGSVAYGNGYVYIASGYSDEDQLIVTVETFRAAFVWLRELVTHPDFTNPEARFDPFVLEIVAHGPGSGERYLALGGSVFIESSPSTDHLN